MDLDLKTLQQHFDGHHEEVKSAISAVDHKVGDVAARLTEVEQKASRRGGGAPEAPKSIGQQVAESPEMKGLSSSWKGRVSIEVKANVTSATSNAAGSAGGLIVPDMRTDIIPMARRKLRVRDLFAQGKTSSNAIEWPRQIGRTNNAASQAEGAVKGQSDMQFDLPIWPVRTLAHFLVASKQILDDAPQLASVIDSDLTYGLKLVEDQQLLSGAGTGTDLLGVYTNATAFSPVFTVTGATYIDVLLLAIAQVDDTDWECDGLVVHPVDWRKIQALKDGMGRYISGDPFRDLLVERLWSMPVATTKAISAGNFLAGAFQQGAQIFDREEAHVDISTQDSDNFRRNLVTIRAEERLALVIKHQEAFVKGAYSTGGA